MLENFPHPVTQSALPPAVERDADPSLSKAQPPGVVWVDRKRCHRDLPPGAWLDLTVVDGLVRAVAHTQQPRRNPLWPAVLAECVVHVAKSAEQAVLVDISDLEASVLAELRARVTSEHVAHVTWQTSSPVPGGRRE